MLPLILLRGGLYLGHDIRDGGGAYDDAVLVLEKNPCVDPRLQTETETDTDTDTDRDTDRETDGH